VQVDESTRHACGWPHVCSTIRFNYGSFTVEEEHQLKFFFVGTVATGSSQRWQYDTTSVTIPSPAAVCLNFVEQGP
jgi:hypothetical protein